MAWRTSPCTLVGVVRHLSHSELELRRPTADSLPSVVVYPTSTEDVVKLVKIAVKYRMPVVPFSGGTSLEGHYLPVSCVDAVRAIRDVLTLCALPAVRRRDVY